MIKTHKYKCLSLYQISDSEKIPFDPKEYSMFKYGSKSMARKFGRKLGDALYMSLSMIGLDKETQFVVLPAPYFYVPTATYALKDYMISQMNRKLIENGYSNPVQEAKVFRKNSYTTEYGSMSEEQRKEAIGSETFHVDTQFLAGKYVIFLDDIFITGSHEERMEEMIERLELFSSVEDILFVYLAERNSDSVNPEIEDYINRANIKDLLSIDYIIKNDEFLFNTRNLKFILKAPGQEFITFISYQSEKFRETLYSYSLLNAYHLEEDFKKNISILKSFLHD